MLRYDSWSVKLPMEKYRRSSLFCSSTVAAICELGYTLGMTWPIFQLSVSLVQIHSCTQLVPLLDDR